MPTDQYRIMVKSGPAGVTDLVGNQLDGEFDRPGVFPSGDSKAGGDFIQDLGLQVLGAPIVTSFQMTAATDTGIAGDQNTKLTRPRRRYRSGLQRLPRHGRQPSGLHPVRRAAQRRLDSWSGRRRPWLYGQPRRRRHHECLGHIHVHRAGRIAARIPEGPDRGRRTGRPASVGRPVLVGSAGVPHR